MVVVTVTMGMPTASESRLGQSDRELELPELNSTRSYCFYCVQPSGRHCQIKYCFGLRSRRPQFVGMYKDDDHDCYNYILSQDWLKTTLFRGEDPVYSAWLSINLTSIVIEADI